MKKNLLSLITLCLLFSCSKPPEAVVNASANQVKMAEDASNDASRHEPITQYSQIKTNGDLLEYSVNVRIPEKIGERLGISEPENVVRYLIAAPEQDMPKIRIELEDVIRTEEKVDDIMDLLMERHKIIKMLDDDRWLSE